jgi:hypothetical protein
MGFQGTNFNWNCPPQAKNFEDYARKKAGKQFRSKGKFWRQF